MVLTIDKTTTEHDVNTWLDKVRTKRKGSGKKSYMAKYYGVLPNLGDGLQIQKQLRNEWR
ncbi:MAG: hypothetical protein LBR84_10620 [Tannerella sp.]|jgi:hypothetical protein|nr:hypothetical protein [Tannerella sp.]